MINYAKEIATILHKGQFRRGNINNKPYITHPQAVANILIEHGIYDETILASAWLHDVIEDTIANYDFLVIHFGSFVADTVMELTSDKKEIKKISKKKYLLERMKTMKKHSLTIKLADRLHNLIESIHMPESFRMKMVDDTEYIIVEIMLGLELDDIHISLIAKILKVIEKYK